MSLRHKRDDFVLHLLKTLNHCAFAHNHHAVIAELKQRFIAAKHLANPSLNEMPDNTVTNFTRDCDTKTRGRQIAASSQKHHENLAV